MSDDDSESAAFIVEHERRNQRLRNNAVQQYPRATLGPRLAVGVNYQPAAHILWIDIINIDGYTLTLSEKDWVDFNNHEDILLDLLTHLEKAHDLQRYVRNFPDIEALHPLIAPGTVLYRIECNDKLSAEILYTKPKGFDDHGYCVRLKNIRPLGVLAAAPAGAKPKRTNHMLFTAAEYDYFSSYALPDLREGVDFWLRTRKA